MGLGVNQVLVDVPLVEGGVVVLVLVGVCLFHCGLLLALCEGHASFDRPLSGIT